jgi:hypothetical protein
MKNLMRTCLLTTLLAMPISAYAQGNGMMGGVNNMMMSGNGSKTMPGGVNCPMAGDMETLQKDMGGMMGEMGGMMNSTSDPALKKRMQEMHDQMSSMMGHMQQMHSMMGPGMIMQGGMMGGNNQNAAPDTPENHHPDKK